MAYCGLLFALIGCNAAPDAIPTQVAEIATHTPTIDATVQPTETEIVSIIERTATRLIPTNTPQPEPTMTPKPLSFAEEEYVHTSFGFEIPLLESWEVLEFKNGAQFTAPDGTAAIRIAYLNTSVELQGRDFTRFAKIHSEQQFGGLGNYRLLRTNGDSSRSLILEQSAGAEGAVVEIMTTFSKQAELVTELSVWRTPTSSYLREELQSVADQVYFNSAVISATFPYETYRPIDLIAQSSAIEIPFGWEQIGASDDSIVQFRSPDSAAVVFAVRRDVETENIPRETLVENVLKIMRELVGPDIFLVSNRVQPDNSLRVDFNTEGNKLQGSVFLEGDGAEANLLGYVLETEKADFYWDVIDTIITSYQ